MTHADTLPPGEAVQCIFNDQTHNTDWAPLSQCAFDLPGTSISASWHRSHDNAVMVTTQSAVQTTAGDSNPANDSMMEVEEETSGSALGVTRHRLDSTATRGIIDRLRDADADDMPGSGDDMLGFGRTLMLNITDQPSAPAIDWASLGRSEFDLLGTSVGASRSRPDTQLVINLDALGRSDITMPGDATGTAVAETTAVPPSRRPRRARTMSANCKSKRAHR